MRIAFDLDDTLIPSLQAFPVENHTPRLLRPLFREPLRKGTRQLLRQLRSDGHDVWIYTTSGRSAFYLRTWFWLLGVRLGGVVNGQTHADWARRGSPLHGSKYPPAFGIALLIDDSDGVAQEGRERGFEVHRVDAADALWAEGVRQAVCAGRR